MSDLKEEEKKEEKTVETMAFRFIRFASTCPFQQEEKEYKRLGEPLRQPPDKHK